MERIGKGRGNSFAGKSSSRPKGRLWGVGGEQRQKRRFAMNSGCYRDMTEMLSLGCSGRVQRCT